MNGIMVDDIDRPDIDSPFPVESIAPPRVSISRFSVNVNH